MNPTELRNQLRGVFGFPTTPFKKDLSVDHDGLARLSGWMAQYPFCAMVAAGGTGEIYSMTVAENIEVVRTVVQATNGKMPVVGGVGYNVPMGVEMARGMEKAGADALLVMPPYYTNAPPEGLIDYYAAIGQATGLPLSLYSRDWASFSPEMVARLCERIPTLTFWKDGQGDARKYQRIMSVVGDRLAWIGGIGDDCAPAYFAVGVQAYTSSISNVAPKLSLAIADAGMRRDFTRMDELMRKYVHPLYAFRDKKKGYEVSVMKRAMDHLGLPGGPVRPPLQEVTADEDQAIGALMETFKKDWWS
jgi:5-dehydro-4-deoxyglucarate dehydratase